MEYILKRSEFNKINFNFDFGNLVFLKGDLGAGKTTLTKHILKNLLKVKEEIISPTYTYYNKYKGILNNKEITIYHFDLYRLNNYDEFFAIAAEEIFDNNSGIILVEWPDIIEKYYDANIVIKLDKVENIDERKIEVTEK